MCNASTLGSGKVHGTHPYVLVVSIPKQWFQKPPVTDPKRMILNHKFCLKNDSLEQWLDKMNNLTEDEDQKKFLFLDMEQPP